MIVFLLSIPAFWIISIAMFASTFSSPGGRNGDLGGCFALHVHARVLGTGAPDAHRIQVCGLDHHGPFADDRVYFDLEGIWWQLRRSDLHSGQRHLLSRGPVQAGVLDLLASLPTNCRPNKRLILNLNNHGLQMIISIAMIASTSFFSLVM